MIKLHAKIRPLIQLVATLASNAYWVGFAKGKIYKGSLKQICLPGLNCYSCPGAVSACPVGSLQVMLAGSNPFTFFMIGILLFFSLTLGRLVCGFLCPFGFFQDLLAKIPLPKIKPYRKVDRFARLLKYGILLLFVILLPLFWKNKYGMGLPTFCKWICPAGVLEGGIPLVLLIPSLRNVIGFLFGWKMAIFLTVVILSLFIVRPFCKYLCPLGAIYGLFNKLSLYQLKVDFDSCVGCHACEKHCPMNVPVLKNINSPECIRCGKCKSVCPVNAIHSKFLFQNDSLYKKEEKS